MKTKGLDSYIVMALAIAAIAIVANIVQALDFIDTAPTAVQKFNIVASGILGQTALVFAMLAAVIAGRHLLTTERTELTDAQQPAEEPPAAEEVV